MYICYMCSKPVVSEKGQKWISDHLKDLSYTVIYRKYAPNGNKLKWLLNKGGGHIFESCDISLMRVRPPHMQLVYLQFYLYTYIVILLCNNSKWCLPFVSSSSCTVLLLWWFLPNNHMHKQVGILSKEKALFTTVTSFKKESVLFSRVGLFSRH